MKRYIFKDIGGIKYKQFEVRFAARAGFHSPLHLALNLDSFSALHEMGQTPITWISL